MHATTNAGNAPLFIRVVRHTSSSPRKWLSAMAYDAKSMRYANGSASRCAALSRSTPDSSVQVPKRRAVSGVTPSAGEAAEVAARG